ncbi:MAG: M20/M25/M40 family metallo-hydrolase [Firmicutes bacterium]|nr:M20/M25/M40 family metallo-hydrolase [Bacillota bacterium]
MGDYQVSEKIREKFEQLIAMDEVQKALRFIEEDVPRSIDEQKKLTLIEAPTFYEDERAAAYCDYLRDLGLEDVHVDEYKNAIGLWRGTGNGPKIMIEAHLDTVFPKGSVKEIREENGVLYAPGIVDDTRGLAILLSALRGLKESRLKTAGDIYFVGTAREEGMGALGGMEDFLNAHPELDGTVSVDGAWTEGITYEATGIQTFAVNFYGIGGHAYGAFGKMANPLHAAARAVAKIADFQVPDNPRTTFCVSNFHAGNDAGIHAIVPKATIKFNFRSNSEEELMKLKDRIFTAIQEACDEETARWGKDTITWDSEQFCDIHAGNQDIHAPIVEATYLAACYTSEDPGKVYFAQGGSVNGNRSVAKGIPAVTLGGGHVDTKCHTLDELYPMEGSFRSPQEVLLMALLTAGVDGKIESVLR